MVKQTHRAFTFAMSTAIPVAVHKALLVVWRLTGISLSISLRGSRP